jgi:hypothetical protein
MDTRIVGAQQRIDSLEKKASTPPVTADLELQAQIARFLCVLSSGFIEQAVIITLENYARLKSSPRIAEYVSSQLSRLQNAKFEDLLVLLGRFDREWREHIETTTTPEVKAAIDSIVNNRNQIAHGRQVNISLGTFSQYYQHLKAFLADLDHFITTQ